MPFETEVPLVVKTAGEAQDQISKDTPSLTAAAANATAQGLPEIAINASQGSQLSILCKLLQAKKILEIGTLGGYSTIWFAQSVPGVRVTSIEFNPHHHSVAKENLRNAGCDNVEVILGAALDVLPTLESKEKFDFVFIDANWDEQAEYFDWAVNLTRQGGAIYVDNVVRQLMEAESDGSEKGKALIEAVSKDERVMASLIPTVSTHKRPMEQRADGYILAYVK